MTDRVPASVLYPPIGVWLDARLQRDHAYELHSQDGVIWVGLLTAAIHDVPRIDVMVEPWPKYLVCRDEPIAPCRPRIVTLSKHVIRWSYTGRSLGFVVSSTYDLADLMEARPSFLKLSRNAATGEQQ